MRKLSQTFLLPSELLKRFSKSGFTNSKIILLLISIFFVPHLVGQNCPPQYRNIYSTVWHYNSYHDRVEINSSMYINICHEKVFEERVRHYQKIYSYDDSVKNESIKEESDVFIVSNLKPCKRYYLNATFSVDRISPDPENEIYTNVNVNYTISTAPVMKITRIEISAISATFNIHESCNSVNNFGYNAILSNRSHVIKNITVSQPILLNNLQPNTNYELNLSGKDRSLFQYTEGWRYVDFKDFFKYEFTTLRSIKGIYSIERDENTVKIQFAKGSNLSINGTDVNKKESSQTFEVKACENFNIEYKTHDSDSKTLTSKRLTDCPCPNVKTLVVTQSNISNTSIKLSWKHPNIRNENILCDIHKTEIKIDRKSYKIDENFFEISLCQIYQSEEVTIEGYNYDGMFLGNGSIKVPELIQDKQHPYSVQYSPLGYKKLKADITWSVHQRFADCKFKVESTATAFKLNEKRAQSHDVGFLDPCSEYNVSITTKLNNQEYKTEEIMIETPVSDIKFNSPADTNPSIKLCNTASDRLKYELYVTWLGFKSNDTCNPSMPHKDHKTNSYKASENKIDIQLLQNSQYKLTLKINDEKLHQKVASYDKTIETKNLDPKKVRNVKHTLDFSYNNKCIADVHLSWKAPCVMNDDYKIYYKSGNTTNLKSIDASLNIHSIDLQFKCGIIYEVCVSRANDACENDDWLKIKTIKEPNLHFREVFIEEEPNIYRISEQVLEANMDMIEEVTLELIDTKENNIFHPLKRNWNPFKSETSDPIRLSLISTYKPYDYLYIKYPYKNLKNSNLVLRLTLKNSIATKFVEIRLNKSSSILYWLVPVIIVICLSFIGLAVYFFLKRRRQIDYDDDYDDI